MVIAADYPFLDVFWTMLVFFGWVTCRSSTGPSAYGGRRCSEA